MLLALINGNASLTDALRILSARGINPDIRKTAEQLLVILKKGRSFSDGLKTVAGKSLRYSSIYIVLVKAAEMTGNIRDILESILADLKRKQLARETIIGVMTYPVIIVVFAFTGTIFIIFRGIPLFIESGFLPAAIIDTAVGGIIFAGLFLFAGGCVIFIVYYNLFSRDSIEFRIFYLLSFLLRGNISIHDALSECIASVGESKQSKALVMVKKEITSGSRLSLAFARSKIFSPYITGWLAIADENGDLNGACRNISDYFQKRDSRIRNIAIKCIEPAIIIITGIYLLILIQTVILPMLTHAGGLW
jgi:type II secretory pathway component PulF